MQDYRKDACIILQVVFSKGMLGTDEISKIKSNIDRGSGSFLNLGEGQITGLEK